MERPFPYRQKLYLFVADTSQVKDYLDRQILNKFLNPENLSITDDLPIVKDVVSVVLNDLEIMLPLGSLVDISQEIERLEKEMKKLACRTYPLSRPWIYTRAPDSVCFLHANFFISFPNPMYMELI